MKVYRNIMIWPMGTTARTKDSDTWEFVTTNHNPSPFSMKEACILTQVRSFFGKLVHHLLSLLAFWIKLLFFASITRLSIYWPVMWQAVWAWSQSIVLAVVFLDWETFVFSQIVKLTRMFHSPEQLFQFIFLFFLVFSQVLDLSKKRLMTKVV